MSNVGIDINQAIAAVYSSDWGMIVATLIRIVGDFDLAEESAQEDFALAVGQWQSARIPALQRAWIIQTARNKAIDRLRRKTKLVEKLESYASGMPQIVEPIYESKISGEIPDERLRLIFTCCHPALSIEAQV